jgi:hypothetical protein
MVLYIYNASAKMGRETRRGVSFLTADFVTGSILLFPIPSFKAEVFHSRSVRAVKREITI